MRQHARFKARYPDCVLFFRMGDFYEMFDEDAVLAHEVLGLTLTQRTKGIPMAGVPHHAVETYLRRMIDAGYRAAVCEQIQDPSEATGVVDRAVTRLLTPGTLVDEPLLDEGRTNLVAAIEFLDKGAAPPAVLATVELSTGSFVLYRLPGDRVLDEVARVGPSELLYEEPADGSTPPQVEAIRTAVDCAATARPAWTFRRRDAVECLCDHYGVATLAGFGIAGDDAVGAAGAVLRYLLDTQSPEGGACGDRLGHLAPPRLETTHRYVTIDAVSMRNLEIERTLHTGSRDGSLLAIFGSCRTAMGKRLVRQWLCFPLKSIEAIAARQRAVAVLCDNRSFAGELARRLGTVQDVARIAGRLSMDRATPRDIVALGRSVGQIPTLVGALDTSEAFVALRGRLGELASSLGVLAEMIIAQCVDQPPAHLREGGLFADGFDRPLDEARALEHDSTAWLDRYRTRLIEETNISSLKVGYNKVFGYFIEITHTHAHKIPPAFRRTQTLKNAERYTTDELKIFQEKITTARAQAIEREKVLFGTLCRAAAQRARQLSAYADVVGELDVLACFGEVAHRHRYACPRLVDEPLLDIRQGRHPVLDRTLAERFVPNDVVLGNADEKGAATLALITGPNMAGKSTYIRQVALIVLLAHAGSFVPAAGATIGLADRIFTRIGATDELHAGRSTFMVEMSEAANILHHATDRSVVILDEIGRGTSTLDGLSLAWAITESLASRRCLTLFATHYHELTALADRRPDVRNLHVAVREWGEKIIFLYRILPGRTDRSYGIHVARIAGLPAPTIARASELLETLAVRTEPAGPPNTAATDAQLGLFAQDVPAKK